MNGVNEHNTKKTTTTTKKTLLAAGNISFRHLLLKY